MSDRDEQRTGRSRYVAIAVAIAAAAAIAPWLLLNSGGETVATTEAATSSTSTVVTSSSTAAPTSSSTTSQVPVTTVPQALTPAFSPFANGAVLNRNGFVPDSQLTTSPVAEFYVDPAAGNDDAAGSLDAPVASLEAAQRLARPMLRAGTGDVVVYLKGGVHARTDSFVLSFQDSGRDDHRMIYRSYPGEQAIIEGGLKVGGWQPAFGDVVVAQIATDSVEVRQFFAAGERQPRARSASADATAIEFVKGELFNAERNVGMVVNSALVADIAEPEHLELVYVGVAVSGHGITRPSGREILRPSWKAHRLPVESATDLGDGTTRLDISNGALYHASERGFEPMEILPTDPFFLENALELLDEPGEWYFDQGSGELYWWPPTPDAVDDAWVAATDVLLAIDGTLSRPVRNVAIDGIAFRHAGFARPNEEGYVVSQAASWFTSWKLPTWMEEGPVPHSFLDRGRPPGLPQAAVEIDSARDISFSGNVFTELGAVGVLVSNDARRIDFDRNLFVDIGAEALVVGHPEHEVIDEPTEGPLADITFSNNVIDRAGAEFFASVGLMITKADGVAIHNNMFRDLPYSAISLGWGWANNLTADFHRAIEVDNNYFENVVNVLYDGAPIYLVGPVAEYGAAKRDFTHIRGNFANNLGADEQFKAPSDLIEAGFAKRPGIQLDAGVRNTLISDNLFAGATVWLQVTTWQDHRDEPGWIEGLALEGQGNWSDTAESVPDDTSLAGVATVTLFDLSQLPEEVRAIIAAAGLEPGVTLPSLP